MMMTPLQQGNQHFRQGKHAAAVAAYVQALLTAPAVANHAAHNIGLARRRLESTPKAVPVAVIGGTDQDLEAWRGALGGVASLHALGWPTSAGTAIRGLDAVLPRVGGQPVSLAILVARDVRHWLVATAARLVWGCPVIVQTAGAATRTAARLPWQDQADAATPSLDRLDLPAWNDIVAVLHTGADATTPSAKAGSKDALKLLDRVASDGPLPIAPSWHSTLKRLGGSPAVVGLRLLAGLSTGRPRAKLAEDSAMITRVDAAAPIAAPQAVSAPAWPSAAEVSVAPVPAARPQARRPKVLSASDNTAPRLGRTVLARTDARPSSDRRAATGCDALARWWPSLGNTATAGSLRPACTLDLGATGHRVGDLWMDDERTLVWRLEATAEAQAGRIAFYQVAPSRDELVGLAEFDLVPGACTVLTLALDQPYDAVLALVRDVEDRWLGTSLLPFPSLVRGGLHQAELAIGSQGPASLDAVVRLGGALLEEWLPDDSQAPPLALSAIELDATAATGAERIGTATLRRWLQQTMGIGLPADPREGSAADAGTPPDARRASAVWRLRLPVDAVPSLAVLVSRGVAPAEAGDASVLTGAQALAEAATSRPRAIVSLPGFDADLLALQPASVPLAWPVLMRSGIPWPPAADTVVRRSATPLAVRLVTSATPRAASLLSPRAPDAPGPVLGDPQREDPALSVIIDLRTGDSQGLTSLLSSLRSQRWRSAMELLLVTDQTIPAATAERWSSAWHVDADHAAARIVQVTGRGNAGLNEAVLHARHRRWLLVSPQAVLHDPRTLQTLARLTDAARTATATAMLVREVAVKKGSEVQFRCAGMFPAQVGLSGRIELLLEELVTPRTLPQATYPVLANRLEATMVNAEAWAAVGGLDTRQPPGATADIDFGLRTGALGWRHLCTTGLSISAPGLPFTQEHADTLALRQLPTGDWHRLLDRATLIRELA